MEQRKRKPNLFKKELVNKQETNLDTKNDVITIKNEFNLTHFLKLKPYLFPRRDWADIGNIIINKINSCDKLFTKPESWNYKKWELFMTALNKSYLVTTDSINKKTNKIYNNQFTDNYKSNLNENISGKINNNYNHRTITKHENAKKLLLNVLLYLENELNLPHNSKLFLNLKWSKKERETIYLYFRDLYAKVNNPKITDSEINAFLAVLGIKPDVKPSNFQLKIIKKMEQELKIPEKNITNRLGREVDEYFESLNEKIKNSSISMNELKELFYNLRLNRFLSTKSLLTIKRKEWYKKMYYINATGKNRNLITKQHYLPRTLIKRWANNNNDYFATNKKTNKITKFNTKIYEGDPFYGINLYEIGGNSNGNMIEHGFNKLEIALNSTIKKIEKQINNEVVELFWIDLKILIQYLICSKFRTKAWFEKNITNNWKAEDLFWKNFLAAKSNPNQIIWEMQKFLEFLVIDWGLSIIENDSIFMEKEREKIFPFTIKIKEFHNLNPQITKSFTKYIDNVITIFKNEDIIDIITYKVYEFIENTNIILFKIAQNLDEKFILPDTAVINLKLEENSFDYPIIELFPLTEKIAFAFIRQTIDSNTSDLSATILNSKLNAWFPNLFNSNLKNNTENAKKDYSFSNIETKKAIMIYEIINKNQINFINKNAIAQTYENYIENKD